MVLLICNKLIFYVISWTQYYYFITRKIFSSPWIVLDRLLVSFIQPIYNMRNKDVSIFSFETTFVIIINSKVIVILCSFEIMFDGEKQGCRHSLYPTYGLLIVFMVGAKVVSLWFDQELIIVSAHDDLGPKSWVMNHDTWSILVPNPVHSKNYSPRRPKKVKLLENIMNLTWVRESLNLLKRERTCSK